MAKAKNQKSKKTELGQIAASALTPAEMPQDGRAEVAFMGRSNAGKSSLINVLIGAKVARISGTPGRTQRINFFAMSRWYMVDLPGFGYARVSKSARASFGQAVEDYVTTRQELIAGVLIQDCRRDPEEDELMVMDWADSRNILLLIVASKMDRLNRQEQDERKKALQSRYRRPVFLVSNRTGEGIGPLREAIRGLGLSI